MLAAIHTLATLVFVAGSAAVSLRLLLLARRTRELPELLLGSAIGCTAVLGYGLLIAAMVVSPPETRPADVPAVAVGLAAIGRTVHDLGVTLFLGFVLLVFRRREPWAWALTGLLAALLWTGMVAGMRAGGLRGLGVGSVAWFCEYAVIWTYPIWAVFESYRYHGLLRRRISLGLASPLVANRFFLWGTGSLFTCIATGTASLPFLFMADPIALARWTPPVRVATALFGLVSITCSLFAFLPPAWYRRRFEAGPRTSGARREA